MADISDFSGHQANTTPDGTDDSDDQRVPSPDQYDRGKRKWEDEASSPEPNPDHIADLHGMTIVRVTPNSGSDDHSDVPGSTRPDDRGKGKLGEYENLIIDVSNQASTSGTSHQGSLLSLSLTPQSVSTEEGGPSANEDGSPTGPIKWHDPLDTCEIVGIADSTETPQGTDQEAQIASRVSGASSQSISCRICRTGNTEEEPVIEMGCSCQDSLGSVHRQCADLWFQQKGNRQCEVCMQIAENIDEPPKVDGTQTEQTAPPPIPETVWLGGVLGFVRGRSSALICCISIGILAINSTALLLVAVFHRHRGNNDDQSDEPPPRHGYEP